MFHTDSITYTNISEKYKTINSEYTHIIVKSGTVITSHKSLIRANNHTGFSNFNTANMLVKLSRPELIQGSNSVLL